jgi:hypothetical protein
MPGSRLCATAVSFRKSGPSVIIEPSMQNALAKLSTVALKARDRALHFFRRERMIEDHARVYRTMSQSGD